MTVPHSSTRTIGTSEPIAAPTSPHNAQGNQYKISRRTPIEFEQTYHPIAGQYLLTLMPEYRGDQCRSVSR